MSVIAILFVITAISGNEYFAWGSEGSGEDVPVVSGTNGGTRRPVHNDAPHVRNIFRPGVIIASRTIRYQFGGLYQSIGKLRADIPELVNETNFLREEILELQQFVELKKIIPSLVNVTKFLQEKMSGIEQLIGEMREHFLCDHKSGVVYNDKCYFAVIHEREDLNFSTGENVCASSGGLPADIPSVFYHIALDTYVRSVMPASKETVFVFVALKYNPETKEIISPNGVVRSLFLSQDYFTSLPEYTAVKMMVHRDPGRGREMFNDIPSSAAYGILCEL